MVIFDVLWINILNNHKQIMKKFTITETFVSYKVFWRVIESCEVSGACVLQSDRLDSNCLEVFFSQVWQFQNSMLKSCRYRFYESNL